MNKEFENLDVNKIEIQKWKDVSSTLIALENAEVSGMDAEVFHDALDEIVQDVFKQGTKFLVIDKEGFAELNWDAIARCFAEACYEWDC